MVHLIRSSQSCQRDFLRTALTCGFPYRHRLLVRHHFLLPCVRDLELVSLPSPQISTPLLIAFKKKTHQAIFQTSLRFKYNYCGTRHLAASREFCTYFSVLFCSFSSLPQATWPTF